MSEKILVPTLGESITEATVSKWLKKEGETVQHEDKPRKPKKNETSRSTDRYRLHLNRVGDILWPNGNLWTLRAVEEYIKNAGLKWSESHNRSTE